MAVAIVNVCADPRLEHENLRVQIRSRLERMSLRADRIFITNDIGGNLGTSMRNVIDMLAAAREEIVFAAILHHDDCVAAAAGLRNQLAETTGALQGTLKQKGLRTPVASGSIRTMSNLIVWSDEPPVVYETLHFRMPSMYGR